MGAVNVSHVLRNWHDLPPRARIVLIAMAHASSDDERENGGHPRRYFGGPAYLAEVLYGPDGVQRGPDGRLAPTESAGRQVRKTLTELVAKKALRRVTVGGKHHKAEYEIVLGPAFRGTETVLQESPLTRASAGPNGSARDALLDGLRGTESVPVRGTEWVLSGGPKRSPQGDQNGPPQEKEEEGGIGEEEDHRPAPQDRARDDAVAKPEDSSTTDEATTPDLPAPPVDDPWGIHKRKPDPPPPEGEVSAAERRRPLADTPLTTEEYREYEAASHTLRSRLGDIPAVNAAMAYAEEHGIDVMRATIELARRPRSVA